MAENVLVGKTWMWLETCCNCNAPFAMSDTVYRVALERREKFLFYCPNGHGQSYLSGESEADKLRRERDRLIQDRAWYEDELRAERAARETAEKRVSAAKGQITKLKKRAAAGVCPCCNRTFANLQRHMHAQHPTFVAEPDATEHVIN